MNFQLLKHFGNFIVRPRALYRTAAGLTEFLFRYVAISSRKETTEIVGWRRQMVGRRGTAYTAGTRGEHASVVGYIV
jgi:hypothetical protein